jgi:hypothetical protein
LDQAGRSGSGDCRRRGRVLQFEFDHRGIGRGELKRCRHFGISRRWRHRQHRELDLADVIIISTFVVVLLIEILTNWLRKQVI